MVSRVSCKKRWYVATSPTTNTTWWRSTAASSCNIIRQLNRVRLQRDGRAVRTRRSRRSMAFRPDGVVSVERSRRPAGRDARDRADQRSCAASYPIFGICLGPSAHFAWPTAPRPMKLKFGHRGGNHPVKNLAHRQDRDHEPEPQLRRGRQDSLAGTGLERHPRQPARRHGGGRGAASGDSCLQRCSITRKARPGPQDSAYLVQKVLFQDNGGTEKCQRELI